MPECRRRAVRHRRQNRSAPGVVSSEVTVPKRLVLLAVLALIGAAQPGCRDPLAPLGEDLAVARARWEAARHGELDLRYRAPEGRH